MSITFLVLASLACSVFEGAEKAIEAGKEAATRVSEVATVASEEGVATLGPRSSEEESPDEDQPALDLDPDALARLDSYRVSFAFEWRPEGGEPEIVGFEEAHTRDPSARRTVMKGMDEGQSVEFVQIGDQSWVCHAGACSQMQADPEELAAGFGDAMTFDPVDVTDEANASFVGREKKNGVQTRHYKLNLRPVHAAFLAQGDVSDLKGDAWIADEPDLPSFAVWFEMSWTEKRQDLTGQASFVYETYDVNVPFTIKPPEGASESGLPEDVPLYPNGEEVFSMEAMTSFSSSDTATEVADFYREKLAAAGWTVETDEAMEVMVQQVWKKGGRTVTLVVSSRDGGSSVMITVEGDG